MNIGIVQYASGLIEDSLRALNIDTNITKKKGQQKKTSLFYLL